ncbi:ABC transporter ATP-binding protein [Paenibacillus flagellatus]|uniref:Multidrug ABC transporter permease n=1 Tax=Paenibacillus flagellatus TaxID=2211139 RepID=A0A2V5K712_9BACL|nr:ABC transporter ATP-binding protein [Paenibacillus flagellatus]PYI55088.1 multidrug ABC transporter permease [Paenibacillus flagellatus]
MNAKPNTAARRNKWGDFVALIRETKPPKLQLIVALVLSLIGTVVSLVIPLFTKNLVDGFSLDSLDPIHIVLLVAAFVAQTVAAGVSIYLLNRTGHRIVAGIRERLWRKLLALPVSYYDDTKTGELTSRVTNDTGIVRGLITEQLSGSLNGIISMIGSIVILLVMDWKMTLVMLIAVPVTFAVMAPLGRQMYRISKGMQDETARFTSVLNQVLSEIRLVKSSNAEPREYENGKAGIAGLYRFGVREGKVQAMIAPVMMLVVMGLVVALIGYGGVRVSSGAMTAGELVAFLLYLFQIVMPATQLSTFFTQFQKAMGATERIVEALRSDEEAYGTGRPVPKEERPIVLEDVRFAYKPGEPVLRGVGFAIEPGKVTAVVGPSGSGKTTLFSLLERYYAPQSGTIRFGADPIDELSLREWRARIGYVSQDSPLIAGTIRDNIVYGTDRDVSREELERAARSAYADAFIRSLPDGYETEVGERGIKLSGGQRQRIAIARALLRDPALLMLDEATSSLDSKSEQAVQEALDNLMRGRTTIVIAHRLSTVVDADRIVFIEKGEVTGIGTHEELFETHPMYREFAVNQLRMHAEAGQGRAGGQEAETEEKSIASRL